jgi:hypothetical protein
VHQLLNFAPAIQVMSWASLGRNWQCFHDTAGDGGTAAMALASATKLRPQAFQPHHFDKKLKWIRKMLLLGVVSHLL